MTEKTVCHPSTDYGASKLASESAIKETLSAAAADWCIIRPALVYGSGNPGNLERLFKLLAVGVPLPFRSVNNLRSFLFVGNLVDAISMCLHHPQAGRETFLLSDEEEISTPDLMRMISCSMNKPVKLFPFPLGGLYFCARLIGKTDEMKKLCSSFRVDSSKIRKLLDWSPPFSAPDGIDVTVKEFFNIGSESV